MPEVVARAPQGWKNEHLNNVGTKAEDGKEDHDISLSEKERRSAWARLLAKVYEVHPFTCPKCQSDMSIISVIRVRHVFFLPLRPCFISLDENSLCKSDPLSFFSCYGMIVQILLHS